MRLPALMSALFTLALVAGVSASALRAEDEVVVKVDVKDGIVTPNPIEIPASRRVVLEITNSGKTPSEFESHELKRELGLFPGSTSRFVIRSFDPGPHEIFDEFHSDKPVAIIQAR